MGLFDLFRKKSGRTTPSARAPRTPAAPAAPDGPVADATDPRAQAMAQIKGARQHVMTPEREELIRQAMAVHKAKQQILADLSDDQRRKLMLTAMRALLHEDKPPDDKDPKP
ncbi:hypothetical protein [Pararhodospirillum oryzae]|uniref:Uncharacterized protein n=1 Tax=Pararhodospirillum oryzae TaxID=478448 RepID=A0A512H6B9_9PROT|nr:hypothetical protein [Pararhodospirillum oryzae]GEO80993.1 hypothetical protein ROR02_11240 [Pararhodospirillum oryzae]